MKAFSSFILFRLLGWKIINDFPQDIKKYVVIAAPHTSWMDFPIAILSRMTSRYNGQFYRKRLSI